MQPTLFSVGENVRLESLDYPQRNGIYLVLAVDEGWGFDRVGNEAIYTVYYKLNDGPGDHVWAQCALRKLKRPDDENAQSIDKMLQTT